MAGHSHSSNIRFRKDRVDAKRAKAFAKLSRMITVAARLGGGSLDANSRLRLAVDKARLLSMPKDGIDRAIKKGTGEGELGNFEEIVYEGYGPGGVALMLEILTDNRHRTAADVRMVMEKFGGNLGTTGAVAWMFERQGRFVLAATSGEEGAATSADSLLDLVLAVGADDLEIEGPDSTIVCHPAAFAEVHQALEARRVALREAALVYAPTQRTVVAEVEIANRLVRLIDGLEDNDDVQTVFSNEDFPDDVVRALEA